MNNLTQNGVDAWNAKVNEVIKCGKPINTPEMEKYKKENPLPTREELKELYVSISLNHPSPADRVVF